MRPPMGPPPGGAMGGVRPPMSGGYNTGYAHPVLPMATAFAPLAPPIAPVTSAPPQQAVETAGKAGFLLHVDDRKTFEWFSYSSQWLLFPFVELAHEADLTPIFRNENVLESRSHGGLDVGTFLGFDARYTLEELQANTKLIKLDMWELDRPRQDTLIPMVKQAVESNQDPNDPRPVTIFIDGPLQQVPQASDSVVDWLKRRAALWVDRRQLKVAMHVLADDATPSLFDQMVDTLQALAPQVLSGQVDLFLDNAVTPEGEQWISSRCPGARCHRLAPETILHDLQVVGAADVFMGAPSYFSTFAGYFFQFDGVIMVGSSPLCKGYFNHHFAYMSNVYGIDDPNLQAALHQMLAGKFGGGY